MKKLLLINIFLLAGCASTVPVVPKFPTVPEELLVKCPELKQTESTSKLSEVIKVVTENYSQYHECRAKADTWIEWYSTQKQIFESVK